MTDFALYLGDFQFARFEIPETIPFGGRQMLAIHRLVGGAKVIDAMGEDPRPPEWSGVFVGQNALDRARYVDGLRKAGQPLPLTWSELAYTVVIREFECDFVRAYRLPYRISCEVVSDDAYPIQSIASPSPEQLVSDDLDAANGLASLIGDAGILTGMSSLTKAISAAGSLTGSSASVIGSILLPIATTRTQVSTLLNSTSSVLGGGILSGGSVAGMAAGLAAQIGASQSAPNLISLDRTLGRMATNLGSINAGAKSITVAGGNLFDIAAQQYGDASGWTALATANKLTDPLLSGISTLTVPAFSNKTGGILNG